MSLPFSARVHPRVFFPWVLLGFFLPVIVSAASAPAETQAFTEFGRVVGKTFRIDELRLTDVQFEALLDGLRQVQAGRAPVPLDSESQRNFEQIQQRIAALQEAAVAAPPPASNDRLRRYLDSARADLQLQQSPSGLLYRIIGSGAGPRPRLEDTVVIDILAKAPDGQTDLPQLSRKDSRIAVAALLPGLAEGIQMLALGGTQILVVPPHLSFGAGPWPAELEPGMPLLFQINLKDILPAKPE